MDPTDPWGTLGARVVEAKGARGARVGEGVSVVSLACETTCWRFVRCGDVCILSKLPSKVSRLTCHAEAVGPSAPYTGPAQACH